jgi:hypothetical protein
MTTKTKVTKSKIVKKALEERTSAFVEDVAASAEVHGMLTRDPGDDAEAAPDGRGDAAPVTSVASSQFWKSVQKKVKGKEINTPVEYTQQELPPVEQARVGFHLRVLKKKTISTAPYEFARITVAFGAWFPPGTVDRDVAFKALSKAADEVLAREVAFVNDEKRAPVPIRLPLSAGGRTVFLEYGVTIKLKEYQSAVVDVGLDVPVADGMDLELVVTELQEWLGERLSEESDAATGVVKSADAGL